MPYRPVAFPLKCKGDRVPARSGWAMHSRYRETEAVVRVQDLGGPCPSGGLEQVHS